jgi:hypothetical protein
LVELINGDKDYIHISLFFLFSFPAAENKHAEEERRDHECLKNNKQKRINAAAAPDAINGNTWAWLVPTAPAEAEKKLTEILCFGQSLRTILR